jgi:nicotinamide phosphoribosyltransferase
MKTVALWFIAFFLLVIFVCISENTVNKRNLYFKEKTILQPFTRDAFGVAIKTTYGEQTIYHHCDHAKNGFEKQIKPFNIFKNPKTDTCNFKKSQKGCCIVFLNQNGKITYEDGKIYSEARNDNRNLLLPLFSNGNLLRETSFMSIRNKLWNNNF